MRQRTGSRPLFIFLKKIVIQGIPKWSSLIYFNSPQIGKTLDYWYSDKFNFNFIEKNLGLVSSAHFVYDFSRKLFLMLFYCFTKFYRLNIITSWDIGEYVIAIVCFSGFNVISFEINLIFLMKLFLCMTKTSRQKFKYLENKKKLLW